MNIDEINKFIDNCKFYFSKIPFFVRIYYHNDKILIWNDHDIYLTLDYENVKDEMSKKNGIKDLTYKIFKKFSNDIEKKYNETIDKKVSIIIPNFNNEKTIKKTIDSILNSTYKNIEVLIIDDCSTDKTLEIIKNNYKDSRVKIFENKVNKGTYYCRNKGVLNAKGNYILFVDGDDFISREKIRLDVNFLDGNENYWGYGTGYIRFFYRGRLDNIIGKMKGAGANYMFRKKLFNYVGYYHYNRFSCDTEFLKRCGIFGYKIFVDKNKVFYYAYTTAGKNLTQIHGVKERKQFINSRIGAIKGRRYIEMGLLDEYDHFIDFLKF